MKQKQTLYIFVSTDKGDAGKVSLWNTDVSDYVVGKVLLCTQEVEIDVPEFDIVQIQVDGIDKKIAKLRADTQVALNALEQQKQELLAHRDSRRLKSIGRSSATRAFKTKEV